MIAEAFVLLVFPLILAVAAGWDIASFTIPNSIPAALIGSFLVFGIATAMPLGAAGGHLLAGAIGLVIGFTLFAIGYVGGGDAKLFAATALWMGMSDLIVYALVATALGGALTILLMTARKLPLPAFLAGEGWLVRLHDASSGIPYGVALAAGAMIILPQTEIFRLATVQ